MNNKTIPVTSPLLPPLEEFIPYLEKIWESRFLTNGGDMHHALEEALCEYLGVKHIVLFANATLALITALQALRVTGEVITTPYSFVATSHALLWNGLKPIFVDIDQDSMNLDPSRIEAAITPQTTAILPVHCYGNPCDVEAIQRIADIHHLKVIYDAAHAFAVRDAGGSVLRHGDLSILSFHATKVFNTFEGGAIICSDENTRQRLNHLKNFGFVDEVTVVMPGINGKLNEVGAAFGLCNSSTSTRPWSSAGRSPSAIGACWPASLASSASGLVPRPSPTTPISRSWWKSIFRFRVTSCTSACATGMCWCGATSTHSSATSPCTIRCPRRRPPIFRWRGRFPRGCCACRSIPGWPPQTSSSSPA